MPIVHDENTLPKWAREKLEWLRSVIQHRENELKRLRLAHGVLTDRNWFVINGPSAEQAISLPDTYHLWFLSADSPHRVCSLHKQDALLVGRHIDGQSPIIPNVVTPIDRIQQFVKDIDTIRAGEGHSLTIVNDNADFGGPNTIIYVSGEFTQWTSQRYSGESLMDCVAQAAKDAREYNGKRDGK